MNSTEIFAFSKNSLNIAIYSHFYAVFLQLILSCLQIIHILILSVLHSYYIEMATPTKRLCLRVCLLVCMSVVSGCP